MDAQVRISSFPGPWGPMWLASTSNGLCGISLREGREALERDLMGRRQGCSFREDPAAHESVVRQLAEYLQGSRRAFQAELDLWGTAFQLEVWSLLRQIPYGETRSYKEIAANAHRPRAFRAVGQANGKNPVPILVPCHRVIQSDGGLGGFGSGLDVKRELLSLEAGRT